MLNIVWLFYFDIGTALCFNILPQQNVTESFSKSNDPPKHQNDFLRGNMNMDAFANKIGPVY